MSWYPLLRTAHVLGAVLLIGNVVVTGVWATLLMARSSGVRPQAVARAIVITDWCFTVPGGALLTVSGVTMAWLTGWSLWDTPFIRHGLVAVGVSTSLWLAVLVPLQGRMRRATDDGAVRAAFRWWNAVGWTATIPLLYGLWIMAGRR